MRTEVFSTGIFWRRKGNPVFTPQKFTQKLVFLISFFVFGIFVDNVCHLFSLNICMCTMYEICQLIGNVY